MQRRETKHEERTRHDSQTRNIPPQRQDIKAETAQDRTAGHFDI